MIFILSNVLQIKRKYINYIFQIKHNPVYIFSSESHELAIELA